MMKLIGGGLAALAATVVLGSGTASANTNSFLSMMHTMGYSSRMSDDELLYHGEAACDLFGRGYSYDEVASEVYDHVSNLSYDDTHYFVGIAKAGLC